MSKIINFTGDIDRYVLIHALDKLQRRTSKNELRISDINNLWDFWVKVQGVKCKRIYLETIAGFSAARKPIEGSTLRVSFLLEKNKMVGMVGRTLLPFYDGYGKLTALFFNLSDPFSDITTLLNDTFECTKITSMVTYFREKINLIV